MTKKTIEKSISIKWGQVDKNIRTHIYNKLCSELVGKCEKEHGYIFSVDKDFKILKNIVSTSGNEVFFLVNITIDVLKPEIGETYEGVVCMVLPLGLLVEVNGKMKILIPPANISGYKFDKTTNTFKKDSKSIKQGDKVKTQLLMEQYEKQSFSCVGKLIKN